MELNAAQEREIGEIVWDLRNKPHIKAVFVAETSGRLLASKPYDAELSPSEIGAVVALLSSILKQTKNAEEIFHPDKDTEESRVILYLWGEETMAMQAGPEAVLIVQFSQSGEAYSQSMDIFAKKISKSIDRTYLSRIKVKPIITA